MVGKGSILISEPYLGDPNFERTVIVVVEDSEEGTVGFIMNKPSVMTVDSVITNLDSFTQEVFVGGPVAQDSLHFIYKGEPVVEDSVELGTELYWGGNFEHFLELARLKVLNPLNFRFFLGYSGWAQGQLKTEISENSWILGNTKIEEVFEMEYDKMWQSILKNMGGKYKMYSNFPTDPRLN
jgi:putative transcriptional regulator